MSLIFLKPDKEYAYRRIARRNYKCSEGNHWILKGEHYIDDHINYIKRGRGGLGYKYWVRHIVCEGCWRAPINV